MGETEGSRSGLKKIKTKLLLGLASLGIAAGTVAVGVAATGGFSPTTTDRQGTEQSGLSEQEQQLVTQLDQINGSILKLQEGADYQQKIYQLAFDRRKIIIDLMHHPATARKVIDIESKGNGSNVAARGKLNTVITDEPSDQLPRELRIPRENMIEQEVVTWKGILLRGNESGAGSTGNNYSFELLDINGQHIADYQILETGQPKPFEKQLGYNEVKSGFAIQSILLPDIGAVRPIKN